MRSPKRLAEIRKLPCVRCGNPNSQAAHSNSSRDGKGRGIKSSDLFVIPLCTICHAAFDRFEPHAIESGSVIRWIKSQLERLEDGTDQTIPTDGSH